MIIRERRNNTLSIRLWGIGFDDKELYNEIIATFNDDFNNTDTTTNYTTTIFSTNPFASIGTAWVYPDGIFLFIDIRRRALHTL